MKKLLAIIGIGTVMFAVTYWLGDVLIEALPLPLALGLIASIIVACCTMDDWLFD